MATLNPMQLISLLKGGNPQVVVQQIIQQNFPNDPTMQNLLKLGQQGDVKSLEQFAQQFFSQRGLDFNSEMKNLMSIMKNL